MRSLWRIGIAATAVVAASLVVWALFYPDRAFALVDTLFEDVSGENAHPRGLRRPPVPPELSAVAQLGKKIFFDSALSASGQLSCASCHSPDHTYGPANSLAVQLGGPTLSQPGFRPPQSLMYLAQQPNFSIGPDSGDADSPPDLTLLASQSANVARGQKNAGVTPAAPAMVPQGGLFWDGRADTLQTQALGPLFNPVEMANVSMDDVKQKLERSPYQHDFIQLFGPQVFDNATLAVAEAMSAIARYQVEDRSFHPYSSKYDYWLEGKARFSRAEMRGMRLFNDPNKANCAGCHLSQPGADGQPPMFTDYQYEALGVPRNSRLAANNDPRFFDMGLCGPFRTDLRQQTQYCGMFLTPTLRNVATRKVFFHNGVYSSLEDVLAFYNERNTAPEKFYPRDPAGHLQRYNDLPLPFQGNIDNKDAPFDRKLGDPPAMTERDKRDIMAFIKTLNDGYPLNTH